VGRKRIGYHYTSYTNWKSILKAKAITPYIIMKKEFYPVFGKNWVSGIWIWQHKQSKVSRACSIISQFATKNAKKAVELKIKYSQKDLLTVPDNKTQLITLPHAFTMENFQFTDKKRVGIVVTQPIPITDIEVVQVHNLGRAFNYAV